MTTVAIECDGRWPGCESTPAMIGDKGYAYCQRCGVSRRASGYERVRKLRPHELRRLQRGEQLPRY